MSDLTDIHSPFNACMFREHCRGTIDALTAECSQLRADNTHLQNNVVMPLRRELDAALQRAEALRERIKALEAARESP